MPPIQIITFFFVLFSYVEFYEKFKPLMLTIHVKAILETLIWVAGSPFMDMILHVFFVKTHLCTLLIPILWQKLVTFVRCQFVFGLIIFIHARYRDGNDRNIRSIQKHSLFDLLLMKQCILGKVMAFFIEKFLTKLYPVARDTGFCWPSVKEGIL